MTKAEICSKVRPAVFILPQTSHEMTDKCKSGRAYWRMFDILISTFKYNLYYNMCHLIGNSGGGIGKRIEKEKRTTVERI